MSTEEGSMDGTESSNGHNARSEPLAAGRVADGPRRERERIASEADPRMSRSMEYGLAILECFSGERPFLGIADLADMIKSSRSTTHRYVSTLVELGYLEQGSRRKYLLAPGAAEPGMAALGALRLSDPAREALERLRDETGRTVAVGVRDGTRALYIDRVIGHGDGQLDADVGLGVGVPLPLHCTAIGKVLLAGLQEPEREQVLAEIELTRHGPKSIVARRELEAELDAIRRSGMAVSDEELRPGLRSIAVVLVDPRPERPIAIDMTVPASACSLAQLTAELAPQLRGVAERVAAL